MFKSTKILTAALLLLIPTVFSYGENPTEVSPMEKVTLTGKLEIVKIPKDPDVISTGDIYWALKLSSPIALKDFKPPVTSVQLVLKEKLAKKVKAQVGKNITIKGQVMEAHTRHHRTPFLLIVESIN